MIDNLRELNDVINAVANRALDIVAEHSTSGQRYVDYSDVADLISKEDFIKFADLIVSELSGRPEVLEEVVFDAGELDINMGLAYCKAYVWCDGDEEIFGCSFEEWLEKKAEPVSHPLSLTRMAEIGHAAVAHILETSDMAIEDLTECVGMSMAEVDEITGIGLEENNEFQHENPRNSITFLVESPANEVNQLIPDFETALAEYKKIPFGSEKTLTFTAFDEQGSPSSGILIMSYGRFDQVCGIKEEALENPHIALAHSKAIISRYPFDEKAWQMRDDAEKKLGITDRVVDISKDLYVSNWRVHVVPTGGRHGMHNTLINEKEPFVEFYDMNHIDPKHSPHGLFTGAQYNLNDLLKTYLLSTGANPSSLRLDMECPEWTVSAKDMKEVVGYLKDFNRQQTVKPSLNDRINQAQAKTAASAEPGHKKNEPYR